MQPIENLNLDWINEVFPRLLPEVVLCGAAIVVLIVGIFKSLNRWISYVAAAGVAISLITLYVVDQHFFGLNMIMGMAALVTILLSHKEQRMEYFLFVMMILLGADLLGASENFIMIMLSIELISISSYALTAGLNPDKQRAEAAWKFFIYGSVATATMIFGMTYLYGYTGSISIYATPPGTTHTMFVVGGLLMLGGFLFKMAAAPFHLWAPDVYEATPAPIIAFLSVAPKLATFGLLMRIIPQYLHTELPIVLIATFSVVVGTLAALSQVNAKRMMAYSSVAQAGFLLFIPALSEGAPSLALYYALVFAIMNYVVFIVIHAQEQSGRGTAFTDFSGIGYTNPLVAVAITLGLVSLVGLPPMGGFMAKLLVFTGIWKTYSTTAHPVFLGAFIIGLLATVASLFFYLRIPFYAFFRRPEERPAIKITPFTNLLLVILVGLLLALFLAPGLFDGLAY